MNCLLVFFVLIVRIFLKRNVNVSEERGESGAAAGAEANQASGQMSAGGNVPLY